MIRLNTNQVPLMVVEWVGRICDDDLETYMHAHEVLLDSKAEHGLVVDLTDARIFETGREDLLKLSRWLDRHADHIAETCFGCAFVVDDEDFRETVDAYFSLQAFDLPVSVFGRRTAAVEWLQPVYGPEKPEHAELQDDEPEGLGESHSEPALVDTDESAQKPESERTEWSPYSNTRSERRTPGP